jgi:hypothetical protein
MTVNEILKTEYSEEFDKLRKQMMATSYYKYGPLKDNSTNEAYNWIGSLEKRFNEFKETKNTEYLADIANFCMMMFMYPEKHGLHYKPTDSTESPGIDGMSVKEMLAYTE